MVDDGTRVSDTAPEILLDAGYTYFGQLLAHDLTKDPSSIDEAWQREPEDLANLQTPKLDLDVLYGGGRHKSPHLYEPDGLRLKLGVMGQWGKPFDICVGKAGERLLADDRGAENLVLRQMTAVFARLHNAAVAESASQRSAENVFERARRKTRHQFQYLVVHDYLRSVLNPDVYKTIFIEGKATVRWNCFSIPIEFSAAAMRFGHAMVRPNYLFRFGKEIFLDELLGKMGDRGALPEEAEISWGFFFQGAGDGATMTSRPIDTRLAPPFQNLPPDLIGTPAAPTCPLTRKCGSPDQLAVRTLLRGAGLRLSSGQAAARAFGCQPLSEEELITNSIGEETGQGRILRQFDLIEETPLWYYILKEAEARENGNRLGRVGSQIIAETICAALRSDSDSFINNDDPQPPTWSFPGGAIRIYGFSELFRLAPLL